MASSSTSCLQNLPQVLHQPYEIAAGEAEDRHRHAIISTAFDSTRTGFSPRSTSTKSTSLLYNFSVLSDKVHQVQSLITLLITPGQAGPEQAPVVVASMETLIQEIIFAASSMMFICQQMTTANNNTNLCHDANNQVMDQMGSNGRAETSLYPETGVDWYGDHSNNKRPVTTSINNSHINPSITDLENKAVEPKTDHTALQNSFNHDIIELDAAELLAKYTHYCQICGKGFKRDANLRMHMRAHGDEYKSRSALSNPLKKRAGAGAGAGNDPRTGGNIDNLPVGKSPRKYSCPQEGCRWNQRHAKFQPLKSLICVKNHYKRSHCPKMYVCKQCNRKQFSVLSDLRTHEKHCMELKWQCSCGTTFSRKDKLMGHVALFTGHLPMINLAGPATGKAGQWSTLPMQMGGDGRGNI